MKKEVIDISFILNESEKKRKIVFNIDAISSLMITNNPGNQAFFSVADIEHKIRGMIENMMGINLSPSDRNKIIEELKKNKKIKELFTRQSSNKWFSIFTHVVDVKVLNPEVFEYADRFDDLHKRLMRRPNTLLHANVCENKTELMRKLLRLAKSQNIKVNSVYFVPNEKYLNAKKEMNDDNVGELVPSKYRYFTNENFNKVTYFHKGTFNRENVLIKDIIRIELSTTQEFFEIFCEKYMNNTLRNDVFLGDSNSLVCINDIKFE